MSAWIIISIREEVLNSFSLRQLAAAADGGGDKQHRATCVSCLCHAPDQVLRLYKRVLNTSGWEDLCGTP